MSHAHRKYPDRVKVTEARASEETRTIAFAQTSVGASRFIQLIDVSDYNNYHHNPDSQATLESLDITLLDTQVDRDNTATGNIRFGVVTSIDGSSANITWFNIFPFSKSDTRYLRQNIILNPGQIKVNSSLDYLIGVASGNISAVNVSGWLTSPIGSGKPDVGDIIMHVERVAGSFDYSTIVQYYGEY